LNYQKQHIDFLLLACKKKDQKAQMELYRRYHAPLYTVAFSIVKNEDDALDALQESFITAIEIAEAENIELQSDYTNATFSTIQNLRFKNDYGKLTVHQVNEIEGEGDFLTLRIGDLYREIDLTHEFGSIKVTHIMPSTERVMINAEYTGIQLGIDPKWSFDYSLDLEYASLKETLNLEPKIQRVESMRKYYNGTVGEYPIAKLTVTTEFGNLKLNPNP
jgi:hypothetical protein